MSPLRSAAEVLADVLEQENAALARLDLPHATALLPYKRAALAAFEQIVQQQAGQEASGGPEPDSAMRAIALRMRASSIENKRLLERAMVAQQHIMSLLAQTARQAAPHRRYGARGGYAVQSAGTAFALSARA